ncbi:MAG: hypothetical protein JXQ71_01330 [Verrucomicrobia bacterium]|nr:hypothetical protein [Verrucomicrobiota bacterium]
MTSTTLGLWRSDWRHGLAFLGCQEVLVQDLPIEQTGDDGIYLGTTPAKNLNRNVKDGEKPTPSGKPLRGFD